MKLPKKLTIEDHQRIGAELKRIHKYMATLSCKIPNTYGKTSRVGKQAARVYDAINQLRNVMENQLYVDYPVDAYTGIYYHADSKIKP